MQPKFFSLSTPPTYIFIQKTMEASWRLRASHRCLIPPTPCFWATLWCFTTKEMSPLLQMLQVCSLNLQILSALCQRCSCVLHCQHQMAFSAWGHCSCSCLVCGTFPFYSLAWVFLIAAKTTILELCFHLQPCLLPSPCKLAVFLLELLNKNGICAI